MSITDCSVSNGGSIDLGRAFYLSTEKAKDSQNIPIQRMLDPTNFSSQYFLKDRRTEQNEKR